MKAQKTWRQARRLMYEGGVIVFYRFGGYHYGGYPVCVHVNGESFELRNVAR